MGEVYSIRYKITNTYETSGPSYPIPVVDIYDTDGSRHEVYIPDATVENESPISSHPAGLLNLTSELYVYVSIRFAGFQISSLGCYHWFTNNWTQSYLKHQTRARYKAMMEALQKACQPMAEYQGIRKYVGDS